MCSPQCIIDKLGGVAFDQAFKAVKKAGNYVLHYDKNLRNLQDEMKNLHHQIEVIGNRVREATDRGDRVVFTSVSDWQTESDKMMGDVVKFLEQSSAADKEKMTGDVIVPEGPEPVEQSRTGTVKMTCSAFRCPYIEQRYRMSKKAEKAILDVQKLVTQALTFTEFSRHEPTPQDQEGEITSMENNNVTMNSRTPIFKDIVDALKESGVNIIGVHGLGGVGKSALVKEIAEKMRADGIFQHVVLVTVSKDFNVMEIQKKLADELNLKLDAPADEKSNRDQLWQKFETGEKYLVILDDIWDKVDLNAIGVRVADGCKVVLTSRKEDLLGRTMGADKNFAIEKLPDPEAQTLSKMEVGDPIESS